MRPLRILTAIIILMVLAVPVMADEPTETTTTVVQVEVCRDDQLISIPADQILESDDRIFNDFQRDNCQPPRVTATTVPLPGPVVSFPPYSVGYACPGTDGVIVELPWGTYEDMWPTIELATLYGCPTDQPVADSPTVAPVVVAPVTVIVEAPVDVLPFTGIPTAGLVAVGLAALLLGGLLVGVARRPV